MSKSSWERRRFWIYRYNTLYRPYFSLGYITVLLFALFAYFDIGELGDAAPLAISVRLTLALTICLILALMSYKRHLNSPLLEAVSLAGAGLFVIWIGQLAISANNYNYHSGIIMLLCYIGTFSRMPWRYGLVTVTTILTTYLLFQSPLLFDAARAVEEERLTVIAFTATVGVISLLHRERQNRVRYRQWIEIRSQRIRLHRYAAQQQRLSETDDLTQMRNRTYLGKLMAQPEKLAEIQRVLLVDIDLFKQLNDLYGHLTGDMVLQRVAKTLQQKMPSCHCIRYGGEEFLFLSCNDDKRLAERLRQAVEQLEFEGICPVTVSIGSAHFDASKGSLNAAIDNADQALYQAKQNGRNRHVAFMDEVA